MRLAEIFWQSTLECKHIAKEFTQLMYYINTTHRALIDLLPPKTLRKPNYLQSKSVTFSQVGNILLQKSTKAHLEWQNEPDQLLVILRTNSFIPGFEKKGIFLQEGKLQLWSPVHLQLWEELVVRCTLSGVAMCCCMHNCDKNVLSRIRTRGQVLQRIRTFWHIINLRKLSAFPQSCLFLASCAMSDEFCIPSKLSKIVPMCRTYRFFFSQSDS
jgi:hypothetical protein